MPRMLRDILSDAITTQADLAIVDPSEGSEALLAAIERSDPDVVVLGVGGNESTGEVTELLRRHPRATVLTVSANGREARLYALRPNVDRLSDTSPQGLLDAVRAALAL